MNQFLKFLLLLLPSFVLVSILPNGAIRGYAQKQGQPLIDSLLKELPKQKDDTNKVNLLNSLSHECTRVNPDEGIKYAQQAMDLSTKMEWKKGIAHSITYLGQNCEYKNDYIKAQEYYFEALRLNEEIGNKEGIGLVTGYIGSLYGQHCDHPKELEYYFKALKIDEEIGDKKRAAWVTGSIGGTYAAQGDYPKALEYYFKTLKTDEEMGDKGNISTNSSNIGLIYQAQGDYPKALAYEFKALKIAEEIGSNYNIAYIDGFIGVVYTRLKYYAKAIEYEQKALKMGQNTASELEYIGDTYLSSITDPAAKVNPEGMPWDKGADSGALQQGKYALAEGAGASLPNGKAARLHMAIDYLQQSIALSKKQHGFDVLIECYRNIAKAYALNGDYRQSLAYTNDYIAIKDSVFSKENTDNIAKMGMDIEYEQKTAVTEKASALKLQRQKNFTYSGIAGILLLAGFSFFIVKERRKSEKLLLNILPAEVAAELKAKGVTKAKHFDNVTVLFTDFVNFTYAGERMSPERLVDELDTCFKAFDEITSKYNVEKIKTIGDAYLAVAGLPTADPKHAEHIVRAAIEINAFMQDRLAKLGNKTFNIRIGIHSGSVVAGIVGVKKFAYDIWGDTVNTAARMEQNSGPGKINISETTYELIKDHIACTYRGEIEAKGKGQLKMYFVS